MKLILIGKTQRGDRKTLAMYENEPIRLIFKPEWTYIQMHRHIETHTILMAILLF